MAKSRPKLPAVILELLPEKHGVYRELLEQILVISVCERREQITVGDIMWKFRATCVRNHDEWLWEKLVGGGLRRAGMLEKWSIRKINRAMRIYDRLKSFAAEIEHFPLTVQYYIADHEWDPACIPLIRQTLNENRELTLENFASEIDPRIRLKRPRQQVDASAGTFLAPTQQRDDEDDDEPMPWEGNGHARKAELLDAEPPESGGENPVGTSPAQKPNLGNPFSGNGNGSHKRPIERSVIRAQVAHEAAEHIHDATKTIRRACQNYGFKGRGQWEEAWFVRFRSGCEEALQALQEWEKVALEESR